MTRSMRGEGGSVKKQHTKKRWPASYDWCPYCFKPCCDPMGSSKAITRKTEDRLERGLCPACGHNPCTCKSVGRTKEAQEYLNECMEKNRAAWLEEHPEDE